jgi:hypothetical protein
MTTCEAVDMEVEAYGYDSRVLEVRVIWDLQHEE